MTGRIARSMLGFVASAGLMLSSATAAAAGQPVNLRENPASGADVTLGDLFDGAGEAKAVVVGYGAPIGQSAVLDAGEVRQLAKLHGLDWSNPNGVRRIMVRSGPPPAQAPAPKTIDALTYTRSILAGEVVQAQDIAYTKILAAALPQDAARDPETVIGMMAARPVRTGGPVARHDLSAAQVIKRDDAVQVSYNSDGVSLTLQGKAMASAAVGEAVGVMNVASNKVIQAIAIGPDQAVVGPDAERLRAPTANLSSQYAALH